MELHYYTEGRISVEEAINNLTAEELSSKSVINICGSDLDNPKIHLFLGTRHYDKLVVHLESGIKLPYIDLLLTKAKAVVVDCPEESITQDTLNLLCIIYPEKAGRLRKAFMLRNKVLPILEGS